MVDIENNGNGSNLTMATVTITEAEYLQIKQTLANKIHTLQNDNLLSPLLPLQALIDATEQYIKGGQGDTEKILSQMTVVLKIAETLWENPYSDTEQKLQQLTDAVKEIHHTATKYQTGALLIAPTAFLSMVTWLLLTGSPVGMFAFPVLGAWVAVKLMTTRAWRFDSAISNFQEAVRETVWKAVQVEREEPASCWPSFLTFRKLQSPETAQFGITALENTRLTAT